MLRTPGPGFSKHLKFVFCSNLLSKKNSNLYIFIKKYTTALKSLDVEHWMLLFDINIYSNWLIFRKLLFFYKEILNLSM